MKSIAYLIPYFGTLPKSFDAWLLSCKYNNSIDFILLTDDHREYNYPENVKVIYTTFQSIIDRIQKHFDFKIALNRPWKLCEFKPAYGEIFFDELYGYDFWGHCDMDLIWGNIRKFITDDILEKYDKIGFQGHSTLYKNTPEVNARYRYESNEIVSYRTAFAEEKGYCFDEETMCEIYDRLHIPYYSKTNFAHLDMFASSFFLGHLPKSEDYKNKRQIFLWKKGNLYRKYLSDGIVYTEEFMYLHFFCRPIKYCAQDYSGETPLVVYPDSLKNYDKSIKKSYIRRHGKCLSLVFYFRVFCERRKKLTLKKVMWAFKTKFRRKFKKI